MVDVGINHMFAQGRERRTGIKWVTKKRCEKKIKVNKLKK